jgi:predicted  nucleic acid-binding Zn-ribbon protein
MPAGGEAPPPVPSHANVVAARESRWLGQEYADITKLRELAAKHDHLASRFTSRQARVLVKIEKLRHVATILREKADQVRGRIPEFQQHIDQNNRQIQATAERTKGIIIGSDVTALHYRNQKFQQKIVDLKDKAQKYEHRAAIKTQKAAELKVKADDFLEHARAEALEAQSYRDRADRLQKATEGQLAAAQVAAASASAPTDPAHRL